MKFEVLAGTHRQAGTDFTKGQIVTSDRDLESLFLCKFKRRLDLEVAAPALVLNPAPKPAVAAQVPVKTEPEAVQEDQDASPASAAASSKGRKDVTADFPEAQGEDVQVLVTKGRYTVLKASTGAKQHKGTLSKTEVTDFLGDLKG